MKSKINKQPEYKKVLNCPNCKSNKIIKRGKRQTENRGLVQRYGCKKCGCRFVKDDGFWKMKNNSKKITLCLDLFYKGISTRQIQQHLKAFYPHNSSNVSIYKWIVKYSNKISKFTEKLNLDIGSEIEVDEMQYKRRKSQKKKGIEENWFIDAIDTQTRYMVFSDYVKARKKQNIRKLFLFAKEKTNDRIKIVTTDGFLMYKNLVVKSFGYDNKERKYKVKHNVVNASRGEGFNHKVERLHSNIRHRTKTFRGFHGSIKSANAIMKGFEIYYNFIRIHQAIGKCPYELATDLQLKNPNKWEELIMLSNKNI